MAKLLVLHGPNLNLLGLRETSHYGETTLNDIDQTLAARAEQKGHLLGCYQSQAEHVLIEKIHACLDEKIDLIIINPAAFTHTSIALRDALLAVALPFIEVHLSNSFAREDFRQRSFFSDKAVGVITGFGAQSYYLALDAAIDYLEHSHGH